MQGRCKHSPCARSGFIPAGMGMPSQPHATASPPCSASFRPPAGWGSSGLQGGGMEKGSRATSLITTTSHPGSLCQWTLYTSQSTSPHPTAVHNGGGTGVQVQHACRCIGCHGQAAGPGEMGGHSRVGASCHQHLVWAGKEERRVGDCSRALQSSLVGCSAASTHPLPTQPQAATPPAVPRPGCPGRSIR